MQRQLRSLADSANRAPVTCRLFYRAYAADDAVEISYGPEEIVLVPGAEGVATWALGRMESNTIMQVGVEVATATAATGSVYLDTLTWDGAPDVTFTRPPFPGTLWRHVWVNAMDHFDARWPEPFHLSQDGGRGLLLADTAPSNHHHEAATQTALASGLPGISHELLDALFMGRMRDDDEFRRAYAAIQPLYRTTAGPSEDRRALESIVFRYRTHNFAFSHNLPSYDLRDRLGAITTPTLVLCGREDWITPLDQSEYMAAHIPGVELAVYDHSGHSPMREENNAFIARIRGFLDAPSMAATTRAHDL